MSKPSDQQFLLPGPFLRGVFVLVFRVDSNGAERSDIEGIERPVARFVSVEASNKLLLRSERGAMLTCCGADKPKEVLLRSTVTMCN